LSRSRQSVITRAIAAASLPICVGIATLGIPAASSQQPDESSVIQHIDAAVKARLDAIAQYTVTEHYAVYRNKDEASPAAEMTVKTTYLKKTGKSYSTTSQSGSAILLKEVLGTILENEQRMSQPGNRESAWITSANYQMKIKPGGNQSIAGRDCIALDIIPRHSTTFLFTGTLWVDSKDYSIVQLEGVASKSASFITGPAQVSRQYATVSGFPMATHAKAVSTSFLLGQTIVKIDYQDYQTQLAPTK